MKCHPEVADKTWLWEKKMQIVTFGEAMQNSADLREPDGKM